MIALITFVAPAPSGASRMNSALVVGGTWRAPLSTTAVPATIPPATAAITALGTWTRARCRSQGEPAGHPAQDEHERDQRQRLDEELGQREIGGTVDDEQPADAVADHPDQQHRGEPAAHPHQGERRERHQHGQGQLQRRVVDGLVRPRAADQHGRAGQGDDGDEDDGEVGRDRARPAAGR